MLKVSGSILSAGGVTVVLAGLLTTYSIYAPDAKSKPWQLAEILDHSVNPCEDFYNYTCNNVVRSSGPDNSPLYSMGVDVGNTLVKLLDQVRRENATAVPRAARMASQLFFTCADSPKELSFMDKNPMMKLDPHVFSFTKDKPLNFGKYSEKRLSQCLKLVRYNMSYATDYIYNVYGKNEPNMVEVENIFNYIRYAFYLNVKENLWASDSLKTYTKKILKKMTFYKGYPIWIKNTTTLDLYYASLPDYEGNLAKDVESLNRFVSNSSNKKFITRQKWPWYLEPSTEVNAYYYSQTNTFYIPSAILLPPVYDLNRPNYLNYGSLGFIIAHEMTHSVDSIREKSSWNKADVKQYSNRSKCMKTQYANFPTKSKRINPIQTNNENVADNGAIHHTFKAYKVLMEVTKMIPESPVLTPEQLLFVSYVLPWCSPQADVASPTDNHSPNHARMVIPLINNDHFAKAFNCSIGTPMNPKSKCVVW